MVLDEGISPSLSKRKMFWSLWLLITSIDYCTVSGASEWNKKHTHLITINNQCNNSINKCFIWVRLPFTRCHRLCHMFPSLLLKICTCTLAPFPLVLMFSWSHLSTHSSRCSIARWLWRPVVDVPQEYLGNESIPPAAWSFLETDKVNYLATIKDRPTYLQNRHVHSEPSFSKKVHMSAAVFFFCSQPALHTDECSSDCVDQLWVSSHDLHSWEFGEFEIQKLAGDGKE